MSIKVAILFGGESCEHEISCISANQAIHALNKDKYDVIPVYISKQRQMYTGDELFDLSNYKDLNNLIAKLKQVVMIKKDNKVLLEPVKTGLFSKTISEIDICMPIMHGTNGEDGTIQGYLEMLKIPYTGCDVISAGIGQDKVIMKHILQNSGIPICPWFWLYGHEFQDNQQEYLNKANKLGYPVIIKPANLGSSIGIEIAHNDQEFIDGIINASNYDSKIVVERIVSNLIEVNCSCLGSRFKVQASALELVGKSDEILSFNDKYLPNGSKSSKMGNSKGMASASRIVPAPLDDKMTNKIKALALETFKVLGASGVCRIDFMIDGDNNEVYVNEINTIPGSLSFYLWEPCGIKFDQLLDELISIAIDNQRRKEKMTFSFDTNILTNYSSGGVKGNKGVKS